MRLAALVVLGLCQLPAWAAGSVYKWVDDQGLVHYDDLSRLEQRLTRSSIARGPVAAEPSATVPAELVTEVRRRCADLRERSQSMGRAGALYGRDPSGNVYRMSSQQAALALAEAGRDQAHYCQPDAAARIFSAAQAAARAERQRALQLEGEAPAGTARVQDAPD